MDERKRSKTGGGPKRRAGAAKREAAAMRLNFDWLTEVLAVGGCFPIQAAERLALEHGISRVVDLRDEDCDEELSLARHGNHADALRLQQRLNPLARAVTSGHGIAGLKAAMDLIGYAGGDARAPLSPVSREGIEEIRLLLQQCVQA